jgi:hypothetical protein
MMGAEHAWRKADLLGKIFDYVAAPPPDRFADAAHGAGRRIGRV